jgi:hypothetical protein
MTAGNSDLAVVENLSVPGVSIVIGGPPVVGVPAVADVAAVVSIHAVVGVYAVAGIPAVYGVLADVIRQLIIMQNIFYFLHFFNIYKG